MNTQTLGRWITIDPENYVQPADDTGVSLLISPYDLPDGVRVRYEADADRFVVEFRYIADEQYRRFSGGNGVYFRLGKHSRRIVGVEVDGRLIRTSDPDLPNEGSTDAYHAIESAIQGVESIENAKARRRENYIVARRVLADKRDDVFGHMQHAVAG